MRKGAWLNRPVHINQKPPTNEYDVKAALAKSLPNAIGNLHGLDKYQMSSAISNLVDATK